MAKHLPEIIKICSPRVCRETTMLGAGMLARPLLLAGALALAAIWAVGASSDVQAQEEKPANPTGLSVDTTQGSKDVSVDWNDVAGADDYLIRWRAADGDLNAGERATVSNAEITVDDYGTWVVRVQACNNVGCSGPTARQFAVEPNPTPEPTPNSPATGTPAITGTPQVGETLTASTSGISDDDGLANATFSYQWLADHANISGATGSTYTLAAADEGKAIKVHVSFTDDAGNDETLTSPATAAVAPPPLTASFESIPAEHDGQQLFSFELRFSENFPGKMDYQKLRDEAFQVENGSVRGASRVVSGENQRWTISVRPDSSEDLVITLPATTDCSATGAVCTQAGRPLSNRNSATVTGPAAPPPLTASFQNVPTEHDGTRLFSFDLRFSENFPGKMDYRKLQDEAFHVENGSVRGATRVVTGGEPALDHLGAAGLVREDVVITLPATTDCSVTGAVCTQAGRALSNCDLGDGGGAGGRTIRPRARRPSRARRRWGRR